MIEIGFWRLTEACVPAVREDYGEDALKEILAPSAKYPDVRDHVDEAWLLSFPADARERILAHLANSEGATVYRGTSTCRICGKHNGNATNTDGVHEWPSGLLHYVCEHAVRLPDEFVQHILSRS